MNDFGGNLPGKASFEKSGFPAPKREISKFRWEFRIPLSGAGRTTNNINMRKNGRTGKSPTFPLSIIHPCCCAPQAIIIYPCRRAPQATTSASGIAAGKTTRARKRRFVLYFQKERHAVAYLLNQSNLVISTHRKIS